MAMIVGRVVAGFSRHHEHRHARDVREFARGFALAPARRAIGARGAALLLEGERFALAQRRPHVCCTSHRPETFVRHDIGNQSGAPSAALSCTGGRLGSIATGALTTRDAASATIQPKAAGLRMHDKNCGADAIEQSAQRLRVELLLEGVTRDGGNCVR